MDSTFRCGDGETLVTYLYGELSPAEHERISAHVARCGTCAEELAALGAARQTLASWTPPERALGFQISRLEAASQRPADREGEATILRPAVWWRRPLPGWAQVAAAAAIFVSGFVAGTSRINTPQPTVTVAHDVARPVSTQTAVTRDDLAQVEQRLRLEMAAVRTSTTPEAADSRAVIQRVTQMIAASEARQQKELDSRTALIVSDFATARKIDNATIEQKLLGTTRRVINNQQDINSLAQRVGYTPGYSPYVP